MTVHILHGDVMDVLKTLPSDSVDCVVTSPPYWGLRDYGTAKWEGGDKACPHKPSDTPHQRGIEKSTLSGGKKHTGHSHEGYKSSCPKCGAVRVDKQIGLEPTLDDHLKIMVGVFQEVRRILKPEGTCWVNYGDCYASTPNGRSAADTKVAGDDDRTFRDKPFSTIGGVLKAKDLCMLPNRFAIALQEAGWWVRSEIIWAKPNPMPESVRDRPATAHEKIFLFTKQPRYFWNLEGSRLPRTQEEDAKGFRGGSYTSGTPGPRKEKGNRIVSSNKKQRGHSRRHDGFNERWDKMTREEQTGNGRNLRNYEPAQMQVWEIATAAFREAHFATFPPELVKRCLIAGCPYGGMVLDPFGGSGTTGLVADKLGMNCQLIELNPAYIDIARNRLRAKLVPVVSTIPETSKPHGELFAEVP